MTNQEAIIALKNAAFIGSDLAIHLTEQGVEKAIEALEKQIPKKPKNYHGDDYPKWVCPRCDKDAYYSHAPHTSQFCPECGQAIDWSDEE